MEFISRLVNAVFFLFFVVGSLIVASLSLAIVGASPAQAQTYRDVGMQCHILNSVYTVIDSHPNFVNENGLTCSPRTDKNQKCYLRYYSLTYKNYKGEFVTIASKTDSSTISVRESQCYIK